MNSWKKSNDSERMSWIKNSIIKFSLYVRKQLMHSILVDTNILLNIIENIENAAMT